MGTQSTAISVKMLSKQLLYDGFTDKYTITQILGNAAVHAHYYKRKKSARGQG